MRRLLATLIFVVVGLCAFPSRADAYFWWWIDDLSGPRFGGKELDIQVWCRSEDARLTGPVLRAFRRNLERDITAYAQALQSTRQGDAAHQRFTKASAEGLLALDSLDEADQLAGERQDEEALAAFGRVLRHTSDGWTEYREGVLLRDRKYPKDAARFEDLFAPAPRSSGRQQALGFVAGAAVSFCQQQQFQRTTDFVALQITQGDDRKAIGLEGQSRMVGVGVSLNHAYTPYLSAGVAGGVAFFSSTTLPSFQKPYLQAYVDFRPLALRREAAVHGPWWQVVYVRAGVTTFPTGFEAGRFSATSPQYKAEFPRMVGLYIDFDPALRKWMGRW